MADPTGDEMTPEQWQDPRAKCVGLLLDGRAQTSGIPRRGSEATLLLIVNAHHDVVVFTLPEVTGGRDWVRLIDTNLPEEDDDPEEPVRFAFGHRYEVTGRSLLLFLAAAGPRRAIAAGEESGARDGAGRVRRRMMPSAASGRAALGRAGPGQADLRAGFWAGSGERRGGLAGARRVGGGELRAGQTRRTPQPAAGQFRHRGRRAPALCRARPGGARPGGARQRAGDRAAARGRGDDAEMTASGIIDALAADHRVIAFDRPGFGYSERPRGRIWTPAAQAALLRQALDRLGAARPVIVGHSWGTMVALEMALRDPDRTAGLVLLSGYYFPTLRLDVPLLFWPAVPVVGDVLRYAVSPWLSRLSKPLLYKWLFAPAPVTQSFAEGVPSELIFRPWQLRATAAEVALLIPGAAALAGRYRELRMPTAIVAGPGDRVIDFDRHSARLYQTCRAARCARFPEPGT